jgi:hypothetical protein
MASGLFVFLWEVFPMKCVLVYTYYLIGIGIYVRRNQGSLL